MSAQPASLGMQFAGQDIALRYSSRETVSAIGWGPMYRGEQGQVKVAVETPSLQCGFELSPDAALELAAQLTAAANAAKAAA